MTPFSTAIDSAVALFFRCTLAVIRARAMRSTVNVGSYSSKWIC